MDEPKRRPNGAVASALVWLMTRSTDLVVRLTGGDPGALREEITAERVRALVAANNHLSAEERALIEEVFAAGKRPLREMLVPRTEVVFLDAALPLGEAARIAAASPHSRFPVYRDSHDEVIGFVHIRDLLVAGGEAADLGELVRPVPYLPATRRVLPVLTEMRRAGHHLAIVMDEYGGTAGIVTLEDLVEELIGDIRDEYDVQDAQAQRLHGGVVEVEGLLNLDDFAAETGVRLPPGPYETVAGHIMAALGRIPAAGDAVEAAGCRLSVVRMDGRRVARVRVVPQAAPQRTQARAGARPVTGAGPDVNAPGDGGVPPPDGVPPLDGDSAPTRAGEPPTGYRDAPALSGDGPTLSGDGPTLSGERAPASDNAPNGA
jgi:CBS domain containing-hemolysin-like protein